MAQLKTQVGADAVAGHHFDMVVIGSGFGSSMFLHEALQHARGGRVLVLEWGGVVSHQEQMEAGKPSLVSPESTFSNSGPRPWNFTIGFGGGTNCWFGQTPRLHPTDFRLHSLYGVGRDWPFGYEELEEYYCDAEEIIAVSGDPDDAALLPRSRPFPQPMHRLSTPDRILKAARPGLHFGVPTARPRIATSTRAPCCANVRCLLCPADAKFTVNNSMISTYENPSVTICAGARVIALETLGGAVRGVRFEHDGREYAVSGDLFVLGANSIHSPAILLRSGMNGGLVGKGLHEAHGVELEVMLDGMDNFDGSTIVTGQDYGCYDGDFRREAGAALILLVNFWKFGLRTERGRWRQTLPIVVNVEELPRDSDTVTVKPDGSVHVSTGPVSDYARAGERRVLAKLPEILNALPVESIGEPVFRPTESHLQGTLRMGRDPAASVVDPGQVHHTYRNLVVVGASVLPSCSASPPSLTVSALSIRAARKLFA